MSTETIDTAIAKKMAEASAIRGASIIGRPGGWSVLLKFGLQEKPLGAQRSNKPRTWKSLDRCVEYLRKEIHISRFDLLDASNHSEESVDGRSREDSALRLRNAHQAAAHDKWFREQVDQALTEADSPAAEWVSNEEARAGWATKRAELLNRARSAA